MTFQKGNKFSVGLSTSGQPPVFENAELLTNSINDYFESLAVITIDDKGKEHIEGYTHPTTTGLALFLGFATRQSLYDYAKRDEYSYIVKRAQLVIESGYEEALLSKFATGAIFSLKNMGWSDKQEIEHVGNNKIIFENASSEYTIDKDGNSVKNGS